MVFVKTKTSYTHGEDMAITVGINKEGKVVGVKLTSYTESKDIGPDYPNRFVGLDASNVGEVDAVAGVTYSSNAFKNAVKYQCFGKTSAIEIADNKKWKSPITYLLGILTLIICGVFYIIFTPLFIVTDIIHLIKSVKDFFYHKKRILTETKIKNLR